MVIQTPSPLARDLPQSLREVLMVAQVRQHPALPQLAMVGHREVQKLVDDHIVCKFAVEFEQLNIEIEIASGGAGARSRRGFALANRVPWQQSRLIEPLIGWMSA